GCWWARPATTTPRRRPCTSRPRTEPFGPCSGTSPAPSRRLRSVRHRAMCGWEIRMGTTPELKGPDLSAGVDAKELKENEPLLGHANGESIVLVRRAGEVCAVGATCTHYGGPLAEGIVEGDTIRCPWHHAQYDLRSGAPTRPGRDAIPCYRVQK